MRFVNFNFKLQDATGNVFKKQNYAQVQDMLGRDAVATALVQYSGLPFWKRWKKRWCDERVYAVIQLINEESGNIKIDDKTLDYIISAVKHAKFDAFVRGEILVKMFQLEVNKLKKKKSRK